MSTRDYCLNLKDARPGLWVKVGSTKSGINRVAEIQAVHKNGNIKLDKWSVFKPEPKGDRAYKTGERNRIGGYTVIYPFTPDESVDAVEQALAEAKAVAAAERKAEEEAKEAQTQAKIKAAWIQHHDGRDIPGSKVASWFDRQGNARITLYFPKSEPMYGGTGYRCQIADFENGSFGSSYCTSMISAEDAVNRWIASWYGPLPE